MWLATSAAGPSRLSARHRPAALKNSARQQHLPSIDLSTDPQSQESDVTQTAAIKLLNAATNTGDGPVFNLEFPQLVAAVQAEIAGAPTQAVINLMGLLDGSTWDTLCVLDTSQGYVSGEISPITFPAPIRQIKGNVATLTGGTNPSISLYFAARG
jgi:hypothetical protein